jgi:hypothetical protein
MRETQSELHGSIFAEAPRSCVRICTSMLFAGRLIDGEGDLRLDGRA